MASKETWDLYCGRSKDSDGNSYFIKTDEEVISMLEDLITTIKTLERMYGVEGSQLAVRAIWMDYQVIDAIAWNRKIFNAPRFLRE